MDLQQMNYLLHLHRQDNLLKLEWQYRHHRRRAEDGQPKDVKRRKVQVDVVRRPYPLKNRQRENLAHQDVLETAEIFAKLMTMLEDIFFLQFVSICEQQMSTIGKISLR